MSAWGAACKEEADQPCRLQSKYIPEPTRLKFPGKTPNTFTVLCISTSQPAERSHNQAIILWLIRCSLARRRNNATLRPSQNARFPLPGIMMHPTVTTSDSTKRRLPPFSKEPLGKTELFHDFEFFLGSRLCGMNWHGNIVLCLNPP